MISASQFRPGMAIRYEGQAYKVMLAEYHPGQGKMGGVTHARLKNLASGTLWEHSFRSDLKVEEAEVAKQPMDFLYAEAGQCCFMNPETFEQVEIAEAMLGPQARLLNPEMRVAVEFLEGNPVSVQFPDMIEIGVADTAPPTHQQADSTFKPAKLANGLEVMVPQFIKTGDMIRLDTLTLKYMERAKTASK